MTAQPRFVTVRQLFDGHRRFRVPIYQRAYAWGQVEIETLFRDIVSVLDKPSYYIGSLVLHEVREVESDQALFDVIDGQQRLTTLFLTLTHPRLRQRLSALVKPFEVRDRLLFFEERARSNLDLATLSRTEVSSAAVSALQDDGIRAGAEAVANLLADNGRLQTLAQAQQVRGDGVGDDLADRVLGYLLDNVEIIVTELPPETDLNHYFEVMNTRGEQLEKHEIVKAHLLDRIGEDHEGRALFATVWDACSDFTRHVQSRFDPRSRSNIFGDPAKLGSEGWSHFIPATMEELRNLMAPTSSMRDQTNVDLDALLAGAHSSSEAAASAGPAATSIDDGDTGRYGAIIDFPNFLLHVLRLQMGGDRAVSLDDKKLVGEFSHTVTNSTEALEFVFRLLQAKFLFDNFVIKPLDEPGSNNESNWVIHRMHYTKSPRSSGKLSPANPFEGASNQVGMLQAMFQVTHARRVYKEFLYEILQHLDRAWTNSKRVDRDVFVLRLHQMAEKDLNELRVEATGGLDFGTDVPHFALNLLDYKLWWLSEIEGRPPMHLPTVKASGFNFAYRTSIEHFLPTNLAERDDQRKVVNTLGNLCLMTRTENSRRSDHTPDWKVEKYGDTDQSLKFYYMAATQRSDREWGPRQVTTQGDAMREVLFLPLPT